MADVVQIFVEISDGDCSQKACELGCMEDPIDQCSRAPVPTVMLHFPFG